MKIEEFEKRFNDIISNPDRGVSDAPDFVAEVRGDYESTVALAEEVETLKARVKDLQESNIKLYLATTGEAPEESEEVTEEDGEEYIESVFNDLLEESED